MSQILTLYEPTVTVTHLKDWVGRLAIAFAIHQKNETPKRASKTRGGNGASIATFGTRRLTRSCEMPRCRGVLRGLEDSNFGIRRHSAGANQTLILRCCANRSPIFLAETTGLRLQTERQCRRLMWPFLPRLGSPPRWRYRHCGASVVTARVPSQPKGSERCRTATHPARRRSRQPNVRRSLQRVERLPRVRPVAGPNRRRFSGCSNSLREQRSPRS